MDNQLIVSLQPKHSLGSQTQERTQTRTSRLCLDYSSVRDLTVSHDDSQRFLTRKDHARAAISVNFESIHYLKETV